MSSYDPNQYPQGQYPQGQYPPPPPTTPMSMYSPESSTRTIRHINVGSAFKVMAVLSGLIWAIIGVFVVLLGACGLLFAANSYNSYYGYNGGGSGAAGIFGLLVAYVIGIFFYAIFGGIIGALYAWLYNMTARMTGGLQVDVS